MSKKNREVKKTTKIKKKHRNTKSTFYRQFQLFDYSKVDLFGPYQPCAVFNIRKNVGGSDMNIVPFLINRKVGKTN